MIWTNGSFKIVDDKRSIDIDIVSELLKSSHWAADRSKETIGLTIENSLCFGLFSECDRIGFARVLTDYATYAVLLDMIVKAEYRGKNLVKWLMDAIINHPSIRHLRQILWTSTAETFYEQFGFSRVADKPAVLVKPMFGKTTHRRYPLSACAVERL